jgi:hypothetical protein
MVSNYSGRNDYFSEADNNGLIQNRPGIINKDHHRQLAARRLLGTYKIKNTTRADDRLGVTNRIMVSRKGNQGNDVTYLPGRNASPLTPLKDLRYVKTLIPAQRLNWTVRDLALYYKGQSRAFITDDLKAMCRNPKANQHVHYRNNQHVPYRVLPVNPFKVASIIKALQHAVKRINYVDKAGKARPAPDVVLRAQFDNQLEAIAETIAIENTQGGQPAYQSDEEPEQDDMPPMDMDPPPPPDESEEEQEEKKEEDSPAERQKYSILKRNLDLLADNDVLDDRLFKQRFEQAIESYKKGARARGTNKARYKKKLLKSFPYANRLHTHIIGLGKRHFYK